MHAAPPYEVVSEATNHAVAVPGDYCRLSLPAHATRHRFMFAQLPQFLGGPSEFRATGNNDGGSGHDTWQNYAQTALDHAWQRGRLIFSRSGSDLYSERVDFAPNHAGQWYCPTTKTAHYSPRMKVWRNRMYYNPSASPFYLRDAGGFFRCLDSSTPGTLDTVIGAGHPHSDEADPWRAFPLDANGNPSIYYTPGHWQLEDKQPWIRRGTSFGEFWTSRGDNGTFNLTTPGAKAVIYPQGTITQSFPNIVFLDGDGKPVVQAAKIVDWAGVGGVAPCFDFAVPGSFDSVRLHIEDTCPYVAFEVMLNVISTGNIPDQEAYDCN